MRSLLSLFLVLIPTMAHAQEPKTIEEWLKKEIIGPRKSMTETQDFVDAKIPRLKVSATAAEWERESQQLRERVLRDVVFRGEAAKWREAKTRVEMLDKVAGTEGYTLKKLRYEILPGFWIPALLYEPEKLVGKVPVGLAVNGHDRNGKAADYKQIRCINMAKRGMIVLNVEWLGMGQLNIPGNQHGAMNQLDLCGSSGLAPFYLSMSRGLDILLNHPHADPKRVAVSGLSGGGWQTIVISSLDTRVTLTNPVAGYSSFRTRIQHFKDLGDSEQTPCDLGTIVDYTHLTAMMAPRATLLTYNAKDNCCFEAGYALPPLMDGALPFFRLHRAEKSLRKHINEDPGDHNFGKENREAYYQMLGDHFYSGDAKFSAKEIDCAKEVKTKDELLTPLPPDNLDINTLARQLAKDLPRKGNLPTEAAQADAWKKERREVLDRLVRFDSWRKTSYGRSGDELPDGVKPSPTTLRLDKIWSIPIQGFKPPKSKGLSIVLHDGGRAATTAKVTELLKAGQEVWAVDLWYFGEAKMQQKDWLWALLMDTVSRRPIGVQASQLSAVASVGSSKGEYPVTIHAMGPRNCTIALIAAAMDEKNIGALELTNPLGSLKEVIESNRAVATTPELFCFGLLEEFDLKQLAAMVAPRPITIHEPSERATKEFTDLKQWYKLLGKDHDPLKVGK